ncbi:hypothetical protein B0H10DRAFT_1958828 [Mycena sp. CBHHK59/15]|nr:hypothetical protein B0H10DRAFT_1958828 [Mycena sp. CBHHK59/15]
MWLIVLLKIALQLKRYHTQEMELDKKPKILPLSKIKPQQAFLLLLVQTWDNNSWDVTTTPHGEQVVKITQSPSSQHPATPQRWLAWVETGKTPLMGKQVLADETIEEARGSKNAKI